MRFTKMHGIGNDYLYVNAFEETVKDPAGLSVRMSERHFGAGSDGLVLIGPSDKADFRMRIYNADGSEAQMCGNASRCIGKYVFERGLTDKSDITLETGAGIRRLLLTVQNGKVESVTVDMGCPILEPTQIPTLLPGERNIASELTVQGLPYSVTCVSMGNPHCVLFVPDPDALDLPAIGPSFERHPAFPERINTEFIGVRDRENIRMRVWERGSGETLACGTGACAAVVACVLNGLTDRCVNVSLRGGDLSIRWDENDDHVYMTGPAAFIYDGVWPD